MGSRLALIVATEQYAEPGLRRLAAPGLDASALAAVLGDPAIGAFEVQVLSNRSAQEVRIAVEDFFAERDRADTLLLHFSGHGLKNAAGELFLAAADTRPHRLASTAVGSDFLSRQMADSRAERIVLFLDCCYGGAFPRGMVVRADTEAQVLDAFSAQSDVGGGKGRAVVTASSAMEYSFEEDALTPGSHGAPAVFTGALVEALTSGEADADGDGWVGLHELFEFVSNAVRRISPHQTPHMWTFGSQGELLIARSKVRRIRPTPLSEELAQALISPLASTRFGLVDLLQQRLVGDDLGLAATAYQTLTQLLDDDSRRVADSARLAVEGARPTVTPDTVRLVADSGGSAEGRFTVVGPPLALVAAVTTTESWIRAEYTEPAVHIGVAQPVTEAQTGSVTVTSPTGAVTVPVDVVVAAPLPKPTSPPPVPAAEPQAALAPLPALPDDARTEARSPDVVPVAHPVPASSLVPTEPASVPPVGPPAPVAATSAPVSPEPGRAPRPRGFPPRLLSCLLLTGAVVFAYTNRPGSSGEFYAFLDYDTTGWKAKRSSTDPWVFASYVTIGAALLSLVTRPRVRGVAFGVLLGSSAFLLGDGLSFLILGFAYEDGAGKWTLTSLVAAAMVALLLVAIRPQVNPLRSPGWLPLSLFALGALVVMSNALIAYPGDGRTPTHVFGVFAYVTIVAVCALAVPALAGPVPETRETLAAAAAAAQIISLVGTYGWKVSDQFGERLAVMLPGTLLILAALALGLWRREGLREGRRPGEIPSKVWTRPQAEDGAVPGSDDH